MPRSMNRKYFNSWPDIRMSTYCVLLPNNPAIYMLSSWSSAKKWLLVNKRLLGTIDIGHSIIYNISKIKRSYL
jgi:hypothetical protein